MIGILIISFVKNHFCYCLQHYQSANCCTTCHKWDSLKELATSIFVNKSQFFINFEGLHTYYTWCISLWNCFYFWKPV